MIFWSALLLGLGGSIHCVAMCGPIAMALPLTAKEKGVVVFQSLLYNLGRVSTYGLMGFFFGLMGWGLSLMGYQNILSIGLGILLLFTALFTFSIKGRIFQQGFLKKYFQKITKRLSELLSIRNKSSAYRIGLLNGFLPCGLVYVALAGSFTTANHWLGALYMIVFGLGTLPLMLSVMVFGKWLRPFFVSFQRLLPYGLVVFGVYLIWRGMMLEIPEGLGFMQTGSWRGGCSFIPS